MTPAEPLDDDQLDGCDIDFAAEADNDETAELRVLFPSGADDPVTGTTAEWRELFG